MRKFRRKVLRRYDLTAKERDLTVFGKTASASTGAEKSDLRKSRFRRIIQAKELEYIFVTENRNMATTEPLEITGLVVPAEDRTLAESIVKAIRKSGSVRLEADGTTFVVPESALPQIVDVLSLTADGQPADVFPSFTELTVLQAAHFLKMSEQRLNKLLDAGSIAFRQDGEQRLILSDHLYEYDRKKKLARLAIAQMTRDSQEMGLYDN